MKKISIVSPTYNEERNILDLHKTIKNITDTLPYDFEFIYIDNIVSIY